MGTSLSFPQMGKVYDTMIQKGVTGEILQTELLGNGWLADLCEAVASGMSVDRDTFRKQIGLGPLELWLEVNYDLSFAEMIALGNYDWKNDDITVDRFPILGKGKQRLKAELIHLNRQVPTAVALAELDKMGLRPGTAAEALAVGFTFPDLQRKFPIVALGQVAGIRGERSVVCLVSRGSERDLGLGWYGGDWSELCRFLAFAK